MISRCADSDTAVTFTICLMIPQISLSYVSPDKCGVGEEMDYVKSWSADSDTGVTFTICLMFPQISLA